MSVIPGRLLNESATIEPYLGIVAARPTFGPPATVRAHIQAGAQVDAADRGGLVGAARAATTTDSYRIWIRPGSTIPVGSRVTARGTTLTASQVLVWDGHGLPTPSHIEMRCELVGFIADTTITITRGAPPTEDDFGDPVDSNTLIAAGLDASIVEEGQTRSSPVDQRGGIVETYNIKLRAGADIREGDRITDDRTGHIYQVIDVAFPHSTTGPELGTDDVRVTARRVAATSTPV